jgi:hypothetical protein
MCEHEQGRHELALRLQEQRLDTFAVPHGIEVL